MLPSVILSAAPAASQVASEAARAASPPHQSRRSLNEPFDIFQNICQSEGSDFFQCAANGYPGACGGCHLSFLGMDTTELVSACKSSCIPDGCNQLGLGAINCANSKIWEYRCQTQLYNLRKCNEGECYQESLAFKECLSGDDLSNNTSSTSTPGQYELNASDSANAIPYIDWESIRENVDEAKEVAGSIHDKEQFTSGAACCSHVTSVFSLLLLGAIFLCINCIMFLL